MNNYRLKGYCPQKTNESQFKDLDFIFIEEFFVNFTGEKCFFMESYTHFSSTKTLSLIIEDCMGKKSEIAIPKPGPGGSPDLQNNK